MRCKIFSVIFNPAAAGYVQMELMASERDFNSVFKVKDFSHSSQTI